jgi:hypothetical protein
VLQNPSLQSHHDRSLLGSIVSMSSFNNTALQQQDYLLPCLKHSPLEITHGRMAGSVPNQTLMQHATATRCGRLRRQWLHNPPRSEYARSIQRHQSNCTLPLATHYMDNTFGLGSHFLLWGQAMCNAMESGHRIQSYTSSPWLWLDQDHCDVDPNISPLHCYLPQAEPTQLKCSNDDNTIESMPTSINVTDPRQVKEWCQRVQTASPETKAQVRAASTEFLFQTVSPLIIQEAQRQIGVIFPNGEIPPDLVTVHIRWGDKFWEMDLASIDEYIHAINELLWKRRQHGHSEYNNSTVPSANIYLATEDPRAYQEFLQAKPPGWNVYADITLQEIDAFRPKKGNRASWAARNTQGRSGLIALGSLLVAMEADLFVLTTQSNWSTLMNHLRTQIVDPQCGNCTDMIDLRPGVW